MKAAIANAVIARAGDTCECGCGRAFGIGADTKELDHALSRREPDSVDSIWALRRACHQARHAARPSKAEWLKRWADFCAAHGYRDSHQRALKELSWVEAKKKAGAV